MDWTQVREEKLQEVRSAWKGQRRWGGGKDHYQMMDFATMECINPWGDQWLVTALCGGGGWKRRGRDALRRATGGRTETRPPAVREGGVGVSGRMVRSYLAGQLAGAQAVLHGQRLGHVGHRLVELLQVALVLHLHVDTGADTEFPARMN